MSNHDELGEGRHLPNHFIKTSDIGVIERRIDLIQQTERRGFDQENGKDQRHCGQGLFPAGQQGNVLQLFPGGLHDYIDTGFQKVFFVGQSQLRLTAAEQPGKNLLKFAVYQVKRLQKPAPRCLVNPLDRLLK